MTSKIALVIIYNHKYDKNIPTLEALYRQRFSHIYHLVPFYTGNQPNVIPVYESSFYFQGYVAQGFKAFFKEEFSHYFFIADDMILNPLINEHSTTDIFKLKSSTSFIPELENMPRGNWPHNKKVAQFNPYPAGTEVKSEIPTYEEAADKLKKHNIVNGAYTFQDVYWYDNPKELRLKLFRYLSFFWDKLNKKKLGFSKYLFVRSYADIFIVSGETIKQFIHYCGVFAATDLWVEVAIPTALALSSTDIQVEKNLELQGKPLWTGEELAELKPFENKLQKLLDHFPPNYIYLHPVKLSKWK